MNLLLSMLGRQQKQSDSEMEWPKKEKMPLDITKGRFLEVFFCRLTICKKAKILKKKD